MEIEKLIYALQETVSYLRSSESFDPAQMSVEEMIGRLEVEIVKAKDSKPVDIILLDRLFAPTGAIQKNSINNGWGTRFLRISETVDRFTASGD
jgi:hypothetical protein